MILFYSVHDSQNFKNKPHVSKFFININKKTISQEMRNEEIDN